MEQGGATSKGGNYKKMARQVDDGESEPRRDNLTDDVVAGAGVSSPAAASSAF
jgi:hypothetical protein